MPHRIETAYLQSEEVIVEVLHRGTYISLVKRLWMGHDIEEWIENEELEFKEDWELDEM